MTKLAHEFNDFNDPCFLSFTPPHPPGAIHNSDMLLILIILKTTFILQDYFMATKFPQADYRQVKTQ